MCREIAGTIDLLPTIADQPDKKIGGKSIVPLLEKPEEAKTPHDAYFFRMDAVRCGK